MSRTFRAFFVIAVLSGIAVSRMPSDETAVIASTSARRQLISYDGGEARDVTRIDADDNAIAVRFSPQTLPGMVWVLESVQIQTYDAPDAEVRIHLNRAGAPGRLLAAVPVPKGPSYPDWLTIALPEALRIPSDFWVVLDYGDYRGHFYLSDGRSDYPERMLYKEKGAWRPWVDSDWLVRASGYLTPANSASNWPPVLEPMGSHKYREGDTILIDALGYDLDEDSLSFSATNLPPGAVFDPVEGLMSWSPGYEQAGTYSGIHFEVNDGNGNIDFEDITIEVIDWPPGDLVPDGEQDTQDAAFLLAYLKDSGPPPEPLLAGDLDLDNDVDFDDYDRYVRYLREGRIDLAARPQIKIVHPPDGSVAIEEEWVHVMNIAGSLKRGNLTLSYSSDGVSYLPLPLVETDNPIYDIDDANHSFLWDTRATPSGEYYLKANYTVRFDKVPSERDFEIVTTSPRSPRSGDLPLPCIVHTSEDIVRVRVNHKPQPFVHASYDTLGQQAILDASFSQDDDGDSIIAYFWHFVCDSTIQEGPVVTKQFTGPDSCYLFLEIWDEWQNTATTYNLLQYAPPFVDLQEVVATCTCVKIDIVHGQGDRVPKDGKRSSRDTSKLKYPPEMASGDSKRLGPIDHVSHPGNMTDIALPFMIEATIAGDAEQCSTVQLVAGTLRAGNGKGRVSKSPTLPTHADRKVKKEFPFKANPKKDELGLKVAYTTHCCGREFMEARKRFIEKKDGIIRWIGTPGYHMGMETERTKTVKQTFEDLFQPSGIEFEEFFYVEILDKVEGACKTGLCKKCFIVRFKYDKNKQRQDVTNDGQPDPPTLIEVTCPTE